MATTYYAFKDSSLNVSLDTFFNVPPNNFLQTRVFDTKEYAGVKFDDDKTLFKPRMIELKEKKWKIFNDPVQVDVFLESDSDDAIEYTNDVQTIEDDWNGWKIRNATITAIIKEGDESSLELGQYIEAFFKDVHKWVRAYVDYGDGTLLVKAQEHAQTQGGAWWNFTSEEAPNSPLVVFTAAIQPHIID